jgi:hypothetical protein
MKKTIVLLALFIALPALAVTLSWAPPATYTDGTPVSQYEMGLMTYQAYTGITNSGPWLSAAVTVPGAISSTVPEPSPGTTLWYTVDVTYLTMTSEKAAAVSKTDPFTRRPAPPGAVVVQ